MLSAKCIRNAIWRQDSHIAEFWIIYMLIDMFPKIICLCETFPWISFEKKVILPNEPLFAEYIIQGSTNCLAVHN